MATPKGGTPIEAGIISQIAGGAVRTLLSAASQTSFFGPGQPLQPVAQDQAKGRAFDYPVNFNITTRPRSYEAIDFHTLRALADAEPLTRLAIETRKDQFGKLRWTIVRRDSSQQDDTAKKIEEFLQEPDREHDFLTWKRMILEDLLVIDAPAVYIRPTRGGQVYALEQMDGATIDRKLDGRGRTPMPPDVAYQQIIKGLPATDYHADELIYSPRNPRIHKGFGYSPVEQILLIVNLALRRQTHQLAFYTAGNIPDMIMSVPTGWGMQQIESLQKYWDLMTAGDLEARRKLRFVPGDLKPLALRPESSLFDQFDEWLARVVCYCFSLPPNAFVKQQNRATAESAQEAALEEGLSPLMEWDVRFMNRIIRRAWKTTDYTFTWLDEQAVDPLVQAQIDQIYVQTGVRDANEVREDHGWDAKPELEGAKLPTSADQSTSKLPPADGESIKPPSEAGTSAVVKIAETFAAALDRIDASMQKLHASTSDRTELVAKAIADLRPVLEAAQKADVPVPTPMQMADALAKMVDSGTPLNKALAAVGFKFTVDGGDVSLVSASRIPLELASDPTAFAAPEKMEKRAPAPNIIIHAPPPAPAPDVKVDVHMPALAKRSRKMRGERTKDGGIEFTESNDED